MTIIAIATCGGAGTITLRDDKQVHATFKKSSLAYQYQLLGNASAQYYAGTNLRVEFDIE